MRFVLFLLLLLPCSLVDDEVAQPKLFDLDITAFDKPNSSAYGWTEAGLGTQTLTYTHESGARVIFKTDPNRPGTLVRTYVQGIGAIGIDDPMVDIDEMLVIQVQGIEKNALLKEMRFVGLTRDETFRILAPGLIYFQQNGGAIASLAENFVRHDEETGSTFLTGGTNARASISGVQWTQDGAEEKTGFPFASPHRMRVRGVGKKLDIAFVGLRFYAIPKAS